MLTTLLVPDANASADMMAQCSSAMASQEGITFRGLTLKVHWLICLPTIDLGDKVLRTPRDLLDVPLLAVSAVYYGPPTNATEGIYVARNYGGTVGPLETDGSRQLVVASSRVRDLGTADLRGLWEWFDTLTSGGYNDANDVGPPDQQRDVHPEYVPAPTSEPLFPSHYLRSKGI